MKTLVILGLVALLLVAVVQWRAGLREYQAERDYPPLGQLVDVDGVKVHALVMGEGPDLVLLHGASGNVREMTFRLAPELAKSYRVIVFDRPSLGWTDNVDPTYGRVWPRRAESPFEQAALLQAAARKLGVKCPIVVGQSFGGAVGWAWALSDPDTAAVVSIAGVANPWPGRLSNIHYINASVAGAALFVPFLTAFASDKTVANVTDSIFAPQAVPQGYLAHIGPELTLRRKTLRGNARQVTSLRPHIVDISSRYSALQMPVEIVHGDADTIVPLAIHSASLPDQIAGAHLTVLKGVGHMPHQTHTNEVVAAVHRAAERAGLR